MCFGRRICVHAQAIVNCFVVTSVWMLSLSPSCLPSLDLSTVNKSLASVVRWHDISLSLSQLDADNVSNIARVLVRLKLQMAVRFTSSMANCAVHSIQSLFIHFHSPHAMTDSASYHFLIDRSVTHKSIFTRHDMKTMDCLVYAEHIERSNEIVNKIN